MKKLLATLLVIGVLFGVTASGEEVSIDLTAMSTDELIALRSEITDEIEKRTATDPMPIYSGRYKVGDEILPGTYVIIPQEAEYMNDKAEEMNLYPPIVSVSNSYDERKAYKEFVYFGEGFTVSLSDGDELLLKYFVGTIQKLSVIG